MAKLMTYSCAGWLLRDRDQLWFQCLYCMWDYFWLYLWWNPEGRVLTFMCRRLIVEFCLRVHKRLSQYSLRAQIIAYYNGIFRLLYAFPAIRFILRCAA